MENVASYIGLQINKLFETIEKEVHKKFPLMVAGSIILVLLAIIPLFLENTKTALDVGIGLTVFSATLAILSFEYAHILKDQQKEYRQIKRVGELFLISTINIIIALALFYFFYSYATSTYAPSVCGALKLGCDVTAVLFIFLPGIALGATSVKHFISAIILFEKFLDKKVIKESN